MRGAEEIRLLLPRAGAGAAEGNERTVRIERADLGNGPRRDAVRMFQIEDDRIHRATPEKGGCCCGIILRDDAERTGIDRRFDGGGEGSLRGDDEEGLHEIRLRYQ